MLDWRRAAVGSTNPAKLAAVRQALAKLAPSCAIEAIAVGSGIGDQPHGDDETRRGAEARARAALERSGADAAFGLEGGVLIEGERVWLLSWAAAVDAAGRVGYGSGLRMLLPPVAADRLRAGDELGVIVDDLFGVHDSKSAAGAIGLLTRGFVSRTEAFADLVAMSLAPHLNPRLYP